MTKKRSATDGGARTPYRGGPDHGTTAPSEDGGLVRDLIQQFADPLAFYRELVQNAIDAGATKILVKLVWEPDPAEPRGVLRASVTDDGTGMTREILEEDLTVLFRSTKESRDDAIGKFGIGFVSVLAVAPEVVVVDTSRGDGTRWSLHLHPDQTYDLYRAETPAGRGTTVTLHVPLPADEQASFVERSEQALVRWCGHARVPIQLLALAPGREEPVRDVRIDRPLAVDALVSVRAQSRDGGTVVVAGLPARGHRSGAFYNQGLLLHETHEHELGEVAFKVMDSRLEHTLSRDDVRRDAHHRRAVDFVAATIRGPLLDAIADAISNHALAFARGGEEGGRRLVEVVAALGRTGLSVAPTKVRVPVIASAGKPETMPLWTLDASAVSTFDGRTPLTEALATHGLGVIDVSFARDDAERELVLAWLRETRARMLPRDVDVYTHVAPIEESELDRELASRTAEHLDAVARAPSELVMARVYGRAAGRLAFGCTRRDAPWIADASEIEADPLRFLLRPALVVSVDHPVAAAARERAGSSPELAANLLARAILIERGVLDPLRATQLTEHGLRAALRGGAR